MANEHDPQAKPQPQSIPLTMIHDLPGIFVPKQPDKSYGGLVTSIQANGVKEAVIVRLREDGEYQLVEGYRRRRACELAKKQDIPAYVYEMTLQEAIAYRKQTRTQTNAPIPGKLATTPEKPKEAEKPAGPEKSAAAPTQDEKSKEEKPTVAAAGPVAPGTDDKDKTTAPKAEDKQEKPAAAPDEKPKEAEKPAGPEKSAAAPTQDEKAKEEKPTVAAAGPAAPGKEDKAPATAPKDEAKQEKPAAAPNEKSREAEKAAGPEKSAAAPAKDEKAKEEKPAVAAAGPAAPGKNDKDKTTAPKAEEKPEKSTKVIDLPTITKKSAPAVTGPAASGPAGTAITQIFDPRLDPPDEKALKGLPVPKEGESLFITLHPAYLQKSKFNTFSVDTSSENYKELRKSVELVGMKDPLLTRINPEGGLEILSDQRRHLAAAELNYSVPAIIQKISDADAKIIVADGNLHRDKISSYDLSRALRMKMEGMKQKAGRRKKGFTAEELNSDVKLAMEMGMSVSKLNRIIRLSEASKDVCDRVDDGSLALSIASAISFLKPANQDEVLHLMDIGYKPTNERIERMKKVEKGGKLNESTMREILEDKDIAPKRTVPPAPTPPTSSVPPTETPAAPTAIGVASIPASPDVKTPAPSASEAPQASPDSPPWETGQPKQEIPAAPSATEAPKAETPAEKKDDIFQGAQERPEHTKVILTGDRLRRYFPDVSMTPREIEESVYEALEERRQRQEKLKQKEAIFKKSGPAR